MTPLPSTPYYNPEETETKKCIFTYMAPNLTTNFFFLFVESILRSSEKDKLGLGRFRSI